MRHGGRNGRINVRTERRRDEMTSMSDTTPAALIRAFIATYDAGTGTDSLVDRPGLAQFLREHGLVNGPVPISPAHHEEAVALRDGLRAHLAGSADAEAIARAQRVLDGLRITVTLDTEADRVFAPAVVEELRRALARIAAAWASVVITGEWRSLRDAAG